MIVGTVMKQVTLCSWIALIADFASNLGIRTWQPPATSVAKHEEIPPIWHRGAVCR